MEKLASELVVINGLITPALGNVPMTLDRGGMITCTVLSTRSNLNVDKAFSGTVAPNCLNSDIKSNAPQKVWLM